METPHILWYNPWFAIFDCRIHGLLQFLDHHSEVFTAAVTPTEWGVRISPGRPWLLGEKLSFFQPVDWCKGTFTEMMGSEKNGGASKLMVSFMENPTQMDDSWGYHYFRKPPTSPWWLVVTWSLRRAARQLHAFKRLDRHGHNEPKRNAEGREIKSRGCTLRPKV